MHPCAVVGALAPRLRAFAGMTLLDAPLGLSIGGLSRATLDGRVLIRGELDLS